MCFRERGEKKERKRRGGKDGKDKKKKAADDEDGLTAKQRRKIVSKAMISSSEGSESEGEKLKIDVGGLVSSQQCRFYKSTLLPLTGHKIAFCVPIIIISARTVKLLIYACQVVLPSTASLN